MGKRFSEILIFHKHSTARFPPLPILKKSKLFFSKNLSISSKNPTSVRICYYLKKFQVQKMGILPGKLASRRKKRTAFSG